MLVHLAEARDGGQRRVADALPHLAAIAADGADIGNAAAGDDDLLVGQPLPRIGGEQPADFDREVGRLLAQRDENQPLANGHFRHGVEDQIVDFSSLR